MTIVSVSRWVIMTEALGNMKDLQIGELHCPGEDHVLHQVSEEIWGHFGHSYLNI